MEPLPRRRLSVSPISPKAVERVKSTKLLSLAVRRCSYLSIFINNKSLNRLSLSNDVRHNPGRIVGPNVRRVDGAANRQIDQDIWRRAARGRRRPTASRVGVRSSQMGSSLPTERVRRDMGLGPYPAIGLSDARISAADARKLIARGLDPLDERRVSRKAER